jgi:hypothetical protein
MKHWFVTLFLLCFSFQAGAQDKDQKLIIITTDGFRWQEVFNGMDEEIGNNKNSSLSFGEPWLCKVSYMATGNMTTR